MDSLYDLSDLTNYTFKVVMEATNPEETAVEWCMKVGLLRDNMTCCVGDAAEKAAVTAKLACLVRVLFYWATMKSCRAEVEDLEVSNATAIKWFKFCREKCSEEMRSCTVKIGGYGSVVECL
ncbi:hypothetical protein AeRB84_016295 [Aphanomyces euteiches]|nr:hypothetical protein AeRB84_016295 [Aphanomyces euteiches]